MSRKIDLRFEVSDNIRLNASTSLLKMRPETGDCLPEIYPGQFVNVKIDANGVFLRRPISICNHDHLRNELWLMVKNAGRGTDILVGSKKGDIYDVLLPLGNGFPLPLHHEKRILLAGGGVGVAPLYLLAKWLRDIDREPEILLGARNEEELLFVKEFEALGTVHVSTNDGSRGEQGLITANSALRRPWQLMYVCGPMVMMKAMAGLARESGSRCLVSLENRMACGLGACLCCVEETTEGNECVCVNGPVFDIKALKW